MTETVQASVSSTKPMTLKFAGWPRRPGTNRGAAMVAPAPAELELLAAEEKTVVLPTVVSRVVEPSLTVLTTGCVVTAVSLPRPVALALPAGEMVSPE